jgi:cytochrome c2
MKHDEPRARRRALCVLGLMLVIFIVLSGLSFLGSRPQVTPEQVTFADHSAVEGKRVFQAYNCMGCHTIVGNGAYFGPDLTNVYEHAGPAWLAAFLPSAGSWPTAVALNVQLRDSTMAAESKAATQDAYFTAYPGARERVERRGGGNSYMPNLPLTKDEVTALIAFLKYTSEMNTEGWPPKPLVNGLENPRASRGRLASLEKGAAGTPTSTPQGAEGSAPAHESEDADPVAAGAQLVKETGCTACHSTGENKLVGPGWGGLYGTTVPLSDGSSVKADDAYIEESIMSPDAKVVAGFTPGIMPNYSALLTEEQRMAIVAYIRSLGRK